MFSTMTSIPQRYLLTIHFDRIFTPSTNSGLLSAITDLLDDIAELARKSGIRLMAEYSIVRGKTGTHAHLITNWMPTKRIRDKRHKSRHTRIYREQITKIMNEHYFRTNNPQERIKKITHNSHIVRRYIHEQSNGEQTIIHIGFYKANFIPIYSEVKVKSYYSRPQFQKHKTGCNFRLYFRLLLISWIISGIIILISFFLLDYYF